MNKTVDGSQSACPLDKLVCFRNRRSEYQEFNINKKHEYRGGGHVILLEPKICYWRKI